MFQLIYLKFTAPTKDEKKSTVTMNLMETQLKNKDLMPESALSDSPQYIMTNYSWRNKPFNVEDLKQVNLTASWRLPRSARPMPLTTPSPLWALSTRPPSARSSSNTSPACPPRKGKKSNWVNDKENCPRAKICHFTKKMESSRGEYELVIRTTTSCPTP